MAYQFVSLAWPLWDLNQVSAWVFSDQTLLSVKTKKKLWPCPQKVIPTQSYAGPLTEEKYKSLSLHKCLGHTHRSRGPGSPFSYKQGSPALHFSLETSLMPNLMSISQS